MSETRGKRSSTGRQSSTKPPTYFLKIAEFISENYPEAEKIIEIGVGPSPYTALYLKKLIPEAEITVTDVDPAAVKNASEQGLKAVVDDAFNPDLRIYEGSDLIYSIRPPPELISALESLAEKVNAALLIFPLSEDAYLSSLERLWKPVRKDRLTAYVFVGKPEKNRD